FGVVGSIAIAPGPILSKNFLVKGWVAGQIGFDAIIFQIRDSRYDVSLGPGLRLGHTQPCEQGDNKSEIHNTRYFAFIVVLLFCESSFCFCSSIDLPAPDITRSSLLKRPGKSAEKRVHLRFGHQSQSDPNR